MRTSLALWIVWLGVGGPKHAEMNILDWAGENG